MKYPINKKCIIRSDRAGVFFATLAEYDCQTRTAALKDCRRLWYWSGAASLSQLAVEGVKNPQECKFTIIVPEMHVMEVAEIIPCTEEAIKNVEAVSVWKR